VELGFGVSYRAAEDAGDLFVVVTFDVKLQKYRTTSGGQSREGRIDRNAIQKLRPKGNPQTVRRFKLILEIRKPFPAPHRLAKVHQHMVRSQSI